MPVIKIESEENGVKKEFKLFESHTILRYLHGRYGSKAQHWYPNEAMARA